jgi:HSP20 family protein
MRRLSLPAAVKQDAIHARYKDGVLEIHLPKAEQSKAKAVKVEKG